MLLADLGADVLKIEAPGGDPVSADRDTRWMACLWYFAGFNRNKKSTNSTCAQQKAWRVLERLLTDADILTINFRPGILDRMGLTEARLREINPGLIVVSVNGYGSTGPYANRPAFDFIAQAMSGYMATNGNTGNPAPCAPHAEPITESGRWHLRCARAPSPRSAARAREGWPRDSGSKRQ